MSHKTNVEVRVDDKESLIKALEEMGYQVVQAEAGQKIRMSAFDWKINADLTIRKDGKSLNVGFIQQEDGSYKIEADFWGTGINQSQFQRDVNQLHGKHKVMKWFEEKRYQASVETDENGNLVVTGSRWKD